MITGKSQLIEVTGHFMPFVFCVHGAG
jgi:hypothetical protein